MEPSKMQEQCNVTLVTKQELQNILIRVLSDGMELKNKNRTNDILCLCLVTCLYMKP